MPVTYVIYNPLSDMGQGYKNAKRLLNMDSDDNLSFNSLKSDNFNFIDITEIDYFPFAEKLACNDTLIICGGDGTLNRFINDTHEYKFYDKVKIFYYPCGSGNDFARDIGKTGECAPFEINKYIKRLPLVSVNGKKRLFLNNVGFGIDGYCTEVGDRMREEGRKKINYSAIAIEGLLGSFKPTNAEITVDGITKKYKSVWLAPTMNGRFYGGGMMPTPSQDRLNSDNAVSLMVFHCKSKLKTLLIFPLIFKGEHTKHKDCVETAKGQSITVTFDSPRTLQIDGETITDVSTYTICSAT